MSKLALLALGAGLAFGQTSPTTPTTGPNTTGSSTAGATAPGQVSQGSSPTTGDRTIPGTPSGTAMRNDVVQSARPMASADRTSLPDTAGNWLPLILAGLSLSAAGRALARKGADS